MIQEYCTDNKCLSRHKCKRYDPTKPTHKFFKLHWESKCEDFIPKEEKNVKA